LLEGKLVNLKPVEKEDLALITEWANNPDFMGEFEPISQESRAETEKYFEKLLPEKRWFIIEKKDGSRIGFIIHFPEDSLMTLGYVLAPKERNKGYCTEAVKLMVDYLFLSKDLVRIQAKTRQENKASQKVLEKAGFKREGTVRQSMFIRGEWRDLFLYSILREEWEESKILTKTNPQKKVER
jgi:RimJ/RimL family protein N-acetyltransferase